MSSSKGKAKAATPAVAIGSNSSSRVLYWHRTDLRLTDSPALTAALSIPNVEAFWPAWSWDPNYVYGHRVGANRFKFLLETMEDLSEHYTRLNGKQRLWVLRGRPEEVWPRIWKEWRVTHMVWEKDSNAYAKVRDEKIKALATEAGIQVVDVPGRHLFDPDQVIKVNGNKATMTLHQWQTVTKKIGVVARPFPAPEIIPDPGPIDWNGIDLHDIGRWEGEDLNKHYRTGIDTCFDRVTGPSSTPFSVPTLSEMGFDIAEATTSIKGGTTQGHDRLSLFLSSPDGVAKFSKPQSSPTSLEPSTTLLSPYIKFGCVGVREIWWGCKDVIEVWRKLGGKGETKEPENMFGQLEFRDMYACAEAATRHFERIRGNSVCRYIAWDLSNQYDSSGNEIQPRPPGDPIAEARFKAWKEGNTGFPWIDACMRQLKHEGWIHHLARHSVACFLTRGQCYISWERGMEVFDELLIDWDPASNPGNWMWLSCSAFFSQYFRVYGLVSWPQKTDKTGQLVRKYCPELKDFPDKYIYSPHLAPLAIQQKAHCIIGKDYPEPMLDEQAMKNSTIQKLKDAYSLGYHGDSPQVLDGSAERQLKALHKESGADDLAVKSEKERKEEEGQKKRKKAGNESLDGFGFIKKVKGG